MVKILIIRTFPSILDPEGYNIQEVGLAKALVRAGQRCDVVLYNAHNGNDKKTLRVPDSDEGIVNVYMRQGIGILKNGFFPGLSKLVKDYDIIQVNEYDQITSWFYYAFKKDRPVVIYHGPYYDDFNKGYNFKCRIFDNTFLKLKNKKDVICFTKSQPAAEFLSKKGFKKTYPIGVGLDTDNFFSNKKSDELHISKFDSEKWNLLYVGKIEPRRNPYMLLDICERLTDVYKDVHMTIIGNGEQAYLEEWKSKADKLISKGVLTYFPGMSQSKLQDVYKKADLMVFPSNYDIFGMVLLEAMYFDLPVVSSFNGGADMLITDGVDGFTIKEYDTKIWTDKIAKLHDDKETYNMIRSNLRQKDHSVYTWDGIAKRYLDILRENKIIKG